MLDFDRYTPEVARRLRRQLQASGFILKIGLAFVGAVFPIAESILVNLATEAGADAGPYIMALIVVGLIHLLLFLALLTAETPLPQLLVELDDRAEELRQTRATEVTYTADNAALMGSVTAAQYSLVQLEEMRLSAEPDLEKAFERVLFSWIEDRTAIFGFKLGSALHNFAVYLESSTDSDLLEVRYRSHDDRLEATNRSWRSGDGHVGTCFLRRSIIFFSDEGADGASEYAETTQSRDEDKELYRSMMATPIVTADSVVRGVFIVTSSIPGQFVRELHEPVIDVVGRLLAQAVELSEAEEGNRDG